VYVCVRVRIHAFKKVLRHVIVIWIEFQGENNLSVDIWSVKCLKLSFCVISDNSVLNLYVQYHFYSACTFIKNEFVYASNEYQDRGVL
jgi:hypothetical protein